MANEQGWISLHREIWDWRGSPIKRRKPLTKFEAWVWLITAASYKDHYAGDVSVKRGQVLTSLERLAGTWRRDRKTVRRWLRSMVEYGEITLEPAKMAVPASGPPGGPTACPLGSLVTICKYEQYQSNGTGNGTGNGTCHGTGNGTHTIKRIKEIKKEKKRPPRKFIRFEEWYSENQTTFVEIAEAVLGASCSSGFGADWLAGELRKIRAYILVRPDWDRKILWPRAIRSWLNRSQKPKPSDAVGRSSLVP